MESFINIAVKKLESTFTDKLRYFILSLLERVTFFDDYYKDKYKIDIIFELMEDYATNDEVDEFNQKISSKIIENLKRNLNKK
jgi:phenylalanyl-tRNA synthetase beta subunit